jgi:hypothetical protein
VAELEDGVRLLHRRAHALGGGDRGGQALFAIDRLLRGDGVEDHLLVPVIRRGDDHGLDLRIGEEVMVILVHLGGGVAAGLLPALQVRGVDVAERDDLRLGDGAGVADEIPAARAEADVAEAHGLLGQVGAAEEGGGGDGGGRGGAEGEKRAAGQ